MIGYKYHHAKDIIKWLGYKPKNYIPLITEMFKSFLSKFYLNTK